MVPNRRLSPFYEDDFVTLYHGDCREVDGWLKDQRVFITDPPYGTGYYASDQEVFTPDGLEQLTRHGTAAVFGWPERLVSLCVAAGVLPSEWVTWWPTNTVGGARRSRRLPRECEHIGIFGDTPGGQRLFRPRSSDAMTRSVAISRGHDPEQARLGDVWRDASPGAGFNTHLRQHPNEKPLSLMGKLVELCSNVGDTVVDPFCGSGTTLVAAKAAGRKAIGIEIEERFCEVAASRCSQDVLAVA